MFSRMPAPTSPGLRPCRSTASAQAETRPGAGEVSAEDILAWCREHLAHYKCPRHIVFAEIPKTSTGKMQKFKLREMGVERFGLQAAAGIEMA